MFYSFSKKTAFLSLIAAFSIFVFQACTDHDQDHLGNIAKELSLTSSNSINYVKANSENYTGQLPESCGSKNVCLIAGQHIRVGDVSVINDAEGNLYVTYSTTAGWYLKEVHLAIADKLSNIPQNGAGNPQIGHFPFTAVFTNNTTTSYTFKITNPNPEVTEGCVVIAAHAVVGNNSRQEETAWGGPCVDNNFTADAKEFTSGKNGSWARYFNYCLGNDCSEAIDFTYAWEDLKDVGNDADYNDLIIKSIVNKSTSNGNIKLYLKFLASARNASYDHTFKVYLPITGYYSINNGPVMNGNGKVELIVFNSTKKAIPTNNTDGSVPCVDAPVSAEFTIAIKGSLGKYSGAYFAASYISPFITVFPSGSVNDASKGKYDLSLWELTGTDTWTRQDGTYPNGILIPDDWKWPLEKVSIKLAYNKFSPISTWNTDWSSAGPSDPTKVFNVKRCD